MHGFLTMIVNIEEAVKLSGKSRSTIQRYIKQGKLSRADKGIDTAELLRVFGDLKAVNNLSHEKSDTSVTEREAWLMAQVDRLQKDLSELKQESLEREKRLMALLEHQSSRDTGGGLFGKFFK
jgi:hypothetical protein